ALRELADVPLPAVVEREAERHAAAVRRLALDALELLHGDVGHAVAPPDRDEPDVLLQALRPAALQVAHEQLPERVDLVLRTLPVLGREGVEREVAHAAARGGLR